MNRAAGQLSQVLCVCWALLGVLKVKDCAKSQRSTLETWNTEAVKTAVQDKASQGKGSIVIWIKWETEVYDKSQEEAKADGITLNGHNIYVISNPEITMKYV